MNQPVDIGERWRLFIAMAAPEAVRVEIEKARAEMCRALREARITWTRREQFHMTLKFLGDIEASRLGQLAVALRGACRGFGALDLRAEGVGCFPDLRRPRVIWVGVREEREQLIKLVRAVGNAVADFTMETREERFAGHVTLGRVKDLQRPESEELARTVNPITQRSFGQWRADTIEIMRSELSPQGPRYTELLKIPLL